MGTLRSLDAATNADMVGLDTTPTLTLSNATTGPGLKVDKLLVTGNASISGVFSTATIVSTATTAQALTLTRTVIGSPSVALLTFGGVSGASIPVLELQANAFVSAVSIVFAASANWAGMGGIRVKLSDGTTYGWIPIIPSASFTAAAI